ncbi:MAG: TIGR02449 family protein [Sinobacterium sp.]|nr:TIGR02449 family protein [Sinobacterium sp.]
MDEQQIIALERKIDELIKLCDTLNGENHGLKSKESNWLLERARLIEKNELARSKIEAMIIRLKSMEQNA